MDAGRIEENAGLADEVHLRLRIAAPLLLGEGLAKPLVLGDGPRKFLAALKIERAGVNRFRNEIAPGAARFDLAQEGERTFHGGQRDDLQASSRDRDGLVVGQFPDFLRGAVRGRRLRKRMPEAVVPGALVVAAPDDVGTM